MWKWGVCSQDSKEVLGHVPASLNLDKGAVDNSILGDDKTVLPSSSTAHSARGQQTSLNSLPLVESVKVVTAPWDLMPL